MTEFDDLTGALRRELADATAAHDDDRAAAMISAATMGDPLGARSWQAPLAAAAVVVVVGGGAAAIAATHGGGGSPSGGGPVACPAVSSSATPVPSTTAAVVPTPAPGETESSGAPLELPSLVPSTSAAPLSVSPTPATASAIPSMSAASASDDPCDPTSAIYVLPPSASAATALPSSTQAPLPTAGVATPSEAPSSTTFVITAAPGTTTSSIYSRPFGPQQTVAIKLHRVSGRGGSLRVTNGSGQSFVEDIIAATAETEWHTIVQPEQFELSCTGTTTCTIRVTLQPPTPVLRLTPPKPAK